MPSQLVKMRSDIIVVELALVFSWMLEGSASSIAGHSPMALVVSPSEYL
jgi:hypothetical protein